VSRFTDDALGILNAAETAASRGESCSDMTILIGRDGAIRMVADSDWPLDSLAAHHGAQTAYRVSESKGSVRVEAREGARTCLLQSVTPAHTARLLLTGLR
jgi:hypothetical protein